MANVDIVLRELVEMSRKLGQPDRDLVILGEGNTSALCDDGSFWVKASGTELRTIEADGFVRLWLDPVRALADREALSDDEFKQALAEAMVDPAASVRRPSVETVLHALALSEGQAKFVGHTHPVAVNALTCSAAMNDVTLGRLFPDEIVVCGPAPVYVPYTDPGLPLARAVRERIRRHMAEVGAPPKVIMLQNHGLIALGANPTEVDAVTSMCVKTCRVLAGTYAFGGPHFLSADAARRIDSRPDEAYRRRKLKLE